MYIELLFLTIIPSLSTHNKNRLEIKGHLCISTSEVTIKSLGCRYVIACQTSIVSTSLTRAHKRESVAKINQRSPASL